MEPNSDAGNLSPNSPPIGASLPDENTEATTPFCSSRPRAPYSGFNSSYQILTLAHLCVMEEFVGVSRPSQTENANDCIVYEQKKILE